jgi:ABC-type multidrug transport system fused ATPase/permease subunit
MTYIYFFIKQLYSFSGRILYLNLLGMGLISLLEGVGILLLIPLLSISGIVSINIEAIPISKAFGFMQDIPVTLALSLILCIYVLLVIGQNLLQKKLTIRNVTIIQGFIHHLRLETYRMLLLAKWDLFLKKRKSDLINLLTTEIGRVTGGIKLFLQLVTSLIFTSIQIGIAFWLSYQMTLFVLVFGFILAFFSRKFIKKSKALGNKTSKLSQEYLSGMTDQLNGIKDIKSNTLEQSRINWLHSLTQKMLEEQIEYTEVKTSSQLFYKIASAILIAFFIFISVTMFHTQQEQFLLVIVIFSRLWPRITSIQSSMQQIASTIPAFEAFIDLQNECENAREIQEWKNYRNINPIIIRQGLECQNVSFRYNQEEPIYALKDINLQIPSNCMTAIVGRSGAGKSTLIDIIMGLNQPEKGKVLIDGTPLTSDSLLSLRRSISYVPQDPFLFNESIRENLLLIEPNASEEQIWEALEFSSAAEFVKSLPKGLDTLIGDRGIRLSGGERQRIVLARAILRKPSILVLDEATSALDTENEAKIQEALEKLKGKMTIIVIAHRLSTIRNADQVVVLDEGEIIQKGAFGQLARDKSGMFSSLLGKQMAANV